VAAAPGTARRNSVLAGLDERALASLLPDLGETPLPSGLVLHEPGQAIRDVYFPLVGVVSIVADLGDDQVVETATVGREGMVGVSVYLGLGRTHRTRPGASTGRGAGHDRRGLP
jgi:CRP-like cAMP-binding protein